MQCVHYHGVARWIFAWRFHLVSVWETPQGQRINSLEHFCPTLCRTTLPACWKTNRASRFGSRKCPDRCWIQLKTGRFWFSEALGNAVSLSDEVLRGHYPLLLPWDCAITALHRESWYLVPWLHNLRANDLDIAIQRRQPPNLRQENRGWWIRAYWRKPL